MMMTVTMMMIITDITAFTSQKEAI